MRFSVVPAVSLLSLSTMALAAADPYNPKLSLPSIAGQPNSTFADWYGYGDFYVNAPQHFSGTAAGQNFGVRTQDSDNYLLLQGSNGNAGHIYSFSVPLDPEIKFNSLGLGDNYTTTIVLQIETDANPPNFNTLTLKPAGGSVYNVQPTITSIPYGQTDPRGGGNIAFTLTWTNLPGNAAGYVVDYTTPVSSSQLSSRVDTLAVATPEPASLGLVGAAGWLTMARRRRI